MRDGFKEFVADVERYLPKATKAHYKRMKMELEFTVVQKRVDLKINMSNLQQAVPQGTVIDHTVVRHLFRTCGSLNSGTLLNGYNHDDSKETKAFNYCCIWKTTRGSPAYRSTRTPRLTCRTCNRWCPRAPSSTAICCVNHQVDLSHLISGTVGFRLKILSYCCLKNKPLAQVNG